MGGILSSFKVWQSSPEYPGGQANAPQVDRVIRSTPIQNVNKKVNKQFFF